MVHPESLLEHEVELRALARRLVDDPDLADDLVQETYLTAIRADRPPLGRTWAGRLREILRVKARYARRQRDRRPSSELVEPSTAKKPDLRDDEIERMLLVLADEVEKLDEPYATTIRQRFLEGLAPREMATQADLPVRTVYTRIARGLQRLRDRMERRLGAGWVLLLDPGSRRPFVLSGRTLAIVATAACAGLALVSIRAIETSEGAWRPPTPVLDPPVELAVGPSGVDASAASDVRAPKPDTESLDRPLPREARAPVGTPRDPAPAKGTYRGRVVDEDGYPVPGVDVLLQLGRIVSRRNFLSDFTFVVDDPFVAHALSEDDGTFVLHDPDQHEGQVVARGGGFQPIVAELVPSPGGVKDLLLPVAPARTLAGTVSDEDGRPVENAWVKLHPAPDYIASMQRRERTWMPVLPSALTDAGGRFRITDAYDMEGARLDVRHASLEPAERLLERGDRLEIAVVLKRDPSAESPLRGRVVDENGEGLANAFLACGERSVYSDEDGAFELTPEGLAGDDSLWVVAAERRPVCLDLERDEQGTLRTDESLLVVVPDPALSIEGRIVDEAGRGLDGVYVWLVDPTHMGASSSTWFAELYVNPTRAWTVPFSVGTQGGGRFRIPYLDDRSYRIGALWIPSWVSTISEPIQAGTLDAALTLPLDTPLETLEGRVVTRSGEPLEGVRVTIVLDAVQVEFAPGRTFVSSLSGRNERTDSEGRFRLGQFPAEGLRIELIGDAILRTRIDATAEAARTIVVPQRAPMKLRVPVELGADRYSLADASGRKLELYDAARYDNSFDLGAVLELPIDAGQSEIAIAPDTAETLVLYQGDKELRRVALRLRAGELNEIQVDPR